MPLQVKPSSPVTAPSSGLVSTLSDSSRGLRSTFTSVAFQRSSKHRSCDPHQTACLSQLVSPFLASKLAGRPFASGRQLELCSHVFCNLVAEKEQAFLCLVSNTWRQHLPLPALLKRSRKKAFCVICLHGEPVSRNTGCFTKSCAMLLCGEC
jgi:hypothetical protein